MTAPLCFIDTETTGVHPGRRPWEIAIIRRDDEYGEREFVCQITDVDLSNADPFGLNVGRFYDRHIRYGDAGAGIKVLEEFPAAVAVERLTRGAHIVGAVPNFDTETLDAMLRRHQLIPAWHYHLIDVETLVVGWLHGLRAEATSASTVPYAGTVPTLPWKSDDLSRACGVEPPSDEERHTALGDAKWAMRMYDAITGGTPT